MRNGETATPASGPLPSQQDEDRIFRKVAIRLVPFLLFCYVGAYLNRINVGFAKLQMATDLGWSEAVYGLGAGIFFIGYFLFEVPSNIIMQRVGAKLWIARIMITWAVISASFFFITNSTQFYVLRFLLGVAEAGFYPGVVLYMMQWFPSRRRSQMLAIFMLGIPVTGILGGPLSGWVLESFNGTMGYAGWRWLFIIEAVPTLLLGVATLFHLDNKPAEARWLTPAQKQLIQSRLESSQPNHRHSMSSMGQVFRNARVLQMAVIYFCVFMSHYGLTFWLPTLIKQSGVSRPLQVGLLSAIPYAVGACFMIFFSRRSDRTGERRWNLIVPMLAGACGFVLAAHSGSNTAMAMVGLSVAAIGVLTPGPLFWALPSAFLMGAAAAVGIAAINSFASLAGFLSPYFIGWLKDYTHSFAMPMYVSSLSLVIGALLVLAMPAKIVNR